MVLPQKKQGTFIKLKRNHEQKQKNNQLTHHQFSKISDQYKQKGVHLSLAQYKYRFIKLTQVSKSIEKGLDSTKLAAPGVDDQFVEVNKIDREGGVEQCNHDHHRKSQCN